MSNSAVRRFSRLNSTVTPLRQLQPRSSVGAGYRCGVWDSQTLKTGKNRFFSGACGHLVFAKIRRVGPLDIAENPPFCSSARFAWSRWAAPSDGSRRFLRLTAGIRTCFCSAFCAGRFWNHHPTAAKGAKTPKTARSEGCARLSMRSSAVRAVRRPYCRDRGCPGWSSQCRRRGCSGRHRGQSKPPCRCPASPAAL